MGQPATTLPCLPAASRLVVLWLLVVVAQGCGQGEPTMTETERVSGLVVNLSDVAADPQQFKSLFVEGAAPAESQRLWLSKHNCDATSVKISGNSASIAVVARDVGTGKVLGEAQWTAEKVGEQWKLKSAPLPGTD